MKTAIQEKICNYLKDSFLIEASLLQLETNILDRWIVDSIHLLQIADFLEKEFKIQLQATDMELSNFSTLKNLTDFVMKKKMQ